MQPTWLTLSEYCIFNSFSFTANRRSSTIPDGINVSTRRARTWALAIACNRCVLVAPNGVTGLSSDRLRGPGLTPDIRDASRKPKPTGGSVLRSITEDIHTPHVPVAPSLRRTLSPPAFWVCESNFPDHRGTSCPKGKLTHVALSLRPSLYFVQGRSQQSTNMDDGWEPVTQSIGRFAVCFIQDMRHTEQ